VSKAAIPEQTTKRSYVPRAEARILLVNATIFLLRELPFPEVTVRKIAERSGLNVRAIVNIFGSQQDLFVAVTRELGDRFAAIMASLPTDQIQWNLLFDENVVLGTRLVSWLIGQGADPEAFKVKPELQVSQTFMARHQPATTTEAQAWLFAQILQYLGEGFIMFGDTHDRRPGDLASAAILLGRIRDELPRLAEGISLGE
jgi:AcrR family transcriptional regulator